MKHLCTNCEIFVKSFSDLHAQQGCAQHRLIRTDDCPLQAFRFHQDAVDDIAGQNHSLQGRIQEFAAGQIAVIKLRVLPAAHGKGSFTQHTLPEFTQLHGAAAEVGITALAAVYQHILP